jgi:probable phosphoglycerate mutase
MTTLLLIRHALCDSVGHSLAGRTPGVHLNATGRAQAAALAERLARVPLAGIYSSPLERTRETAEAIAARQAGAPGRTVAVEVVPELLELDFGDWTGRTLAELDGDERWRAFNRFRSSTRIPGGELIVEVQARAVGALERLIQRHPAATVAVVSHGDVLRAMLAYYLGVPLDLMARLTVDPASVSIVRAGHFDAKVQCINLTAGWPDGLDS